MPVFGLIDHSCVVIIFVGPCWRMVVKGYIGQVCYGFHCNTETGRGVLKSYFQHELYSYQIVVVLLIRKKRPILWASYDRSAMQ